MGLINLVPVKTGSSVTLMSYKHLIFRKYLVWTSKVGYVLGGPDVDANNWKNHDRISSSIAEHWHVSPQPLLEIKKKKHAPRTVSWQFRSGWQKKKQVAEIPESEQRLLVVAVLAGGNDTKTTQIAGDNQIDFAWSTCDSGFCALFTGALRALRSHKDRFCFDILGFSQELPKGLYRV
jgi:hypothetical protein